MGTEMPDCRTLCCWATTMEHRHVQRIAEALAVIENKLKFNFNLSHWCADRQRKREAGRNAFAIVSLLCFPSYAVAWQCYQLWFFPVKSSFFLMMPYLFFCIHSALFIAALYFFLIFNFLLSRILETLLPWTSIILHRYRSSFGNCDCDMR